MGVTEVTSALVFNIPDFGSTHSQFIIHHIPSMGNLSCSVLDNWQRGDAIGGEETAAHFTGTVQVIL